MPRKRYQKYSRGANKQEIQRENFPSFEEFLKAYLQNASTTQGEAGKQGARGLQGIRGLGIARVYKENTELFVEYEDGATQYVGSVADGKDGQDGVSPDVDKIAKRAWRLYREKLFLYIKESIPAPVTGPVGPQGPQGEMPRHEVQGDRIRFELPNGKWGQWIDLPKPSSQPPAITSSGVGRFTELKDTPRSYTGQAGKVLVVSDTEKSLKLVDADFGGGGVTDHGALTGLEDDDHAQYALADGSRGDFASTNHSHAISDVTNLQNALDGKADNGEGVPVGGTAGQVLAKVDDTDYNTEWTDPSNGTSYTNEEAQDAIGTILADSGELDFTYDDATPSISAILKSASVAKTKLTTAVQTSLGLADSATQPGDLATVATSGDYSDLSNTPDLSVYDNFEPYTNEADFPATGSAEVIYLETSTGRMYRWTGSAYEIISAKLALGETSATAYRGDRGKIAYDHSQVTTGNPHSISYSDLEGTLPSHTHPASEVADFDAEVANNSAVSANTSKRTYPSADESKLAGVDAGAEQNVQSDWNASSGDAKILNKPSIPTNNNQLTNGKGYITDYSVSESDVNQYPVMGTVVHGSTANTARPSGYSVVTWIGSVEPQSALNNDIWQKLN